MRSRISAASTGAGDRERADERRDPQAPPRLRRDRIAAASSASPRAYVIVQNQRLRIPVLEQRPFELKAEFQTAQAVVPGQGQTLRVAGVKVGDVEDVELQDGVAVVTFGVDRDYLPVYRDATILLRPQTGLKDMFFEMDPGTQRAGEIDEGGTVVLANTAPDVNLDEVLGALDSDTQGLPAAAARQRRPGARWARQGPRQAARLARPADPRRRPDQLEGRRAQAEPAAAGHELQPADPRGRPQRTQPDRARQRVEHDDRRDRRAGSERPAGDPAVARDAAAVDGRARAHRQFADQLGPAFTDLRPFARNLEEVNASTKRLAIQTTPVIKEEIRPFVRTARRPVPDLTRPRAGSQGDPEADRGREEDQPPRQHGRIQPGRGRAGRYARARRGLPVLGLRGSATTATRSSDQDANGFERRIYLTIGCDEASRCSARARWRLRYRAPRCSLPAGRSMGAVERRDGLGCRSPHHRSAGSSSPWASRSRASCCCCSSGSRSAVRCR